MLLLHVYKKSITKNPASAKKPPKKFAKAVALPFSPNRQAAVSGVPKKPERVPRLMC